MANKVIILDAFARASFPHLDVPFAHDPKDAEKYRLQLMFAKSGIYDHPEVGELKSDPYEIIDALNEVCVTEFNFPIHEVEDVANLKEEVGISFPPAFKDGDKVKLKKDGRPVPGEYDPLVAGYWLINLTSNEKPGCIGPDENEVDPKTIYSGCWVRVQIEVSAYYNKQNNAPIVNLDLMNVQYCYDDVSLGGRAPRQDAKTAFSGRSITNSNVKTGTGARMGRPAEGGRPSRPSRNDEVVTERVCKSTGDFTVEEMIEDGWTEQDLVDEGYAEWVEVEAKKPSRPSRPERKAPPAKPSRPSRPERKAPPSKKAPPQRKKAGPTIVLFDDCDYTYEELSVEYGFSDDEIVNSGYGEFNYTDPDA